MGDDMHDLILAPMQGGASTQFAMLPFNLAAQGDATDYVVTGAWSKKAYEEGQKFSKANLVAKGDNKSVPAPSTWKLTPGSKYVHYCDNETIGGVEFKVGWKGKSVQYNAKGKSTYRYPFLPSIHPSPTHLDFSA
jgi:phosphoserine aminotransferase